MVSADSNIPNFSANTPTSSSQINANNQLVSPAAYDAAGNQPETFIGGTGIVLAYDAEDRLSTYQVTGATQEAYSYDGEGRRVEQQHEAYSGGGYNAATTVYYVYDALGQLAAEYGNPSSALP